MILSVVSLSSTNKTGMKARINYILILIFILTLSDVKGQVYILKNDSINAQQDTVATLKIPDYRGVLNWQVSFDKNIWHSSIKTGIDSFNVNPGAAAWYRAKITDGSCAPVFSEIFQVHIPDSLGEGIESNGRDHHVPFAGEPVSVIINNDTIRVVRLNDLYYFQGDIVFSEAELRLLTGSKGASIPTAFKFRLWPNRTVYYSIDSGFEKPDRVNRAIRHYERHTPLKFVQRSNETNYILFTNSDRSNSRLGMTGEMQILNIKTDADDATVIHELGHAIGLVHEHSRPDRDKELNVLYDNIKENVVDQNGNVIDIYSQFDISKYAYQHGKLDFSSVMIYASFNAFGKFPAEKPTMVKKDGTPWEKNKSLSKGDIDLIKFLYSDVPRLATMAVTDFRVNSAVCGGNIYSDGGSAVTERGICWNTTGNPEADKIYTSVNGSGTGSFISVITDLEPDKTYYVRAFAENSKGFGYGNEVVFKNSTSISVPEVVTHEHDLRIYFTETGTFSSVLTHVSGEVLNEGGSTVTERGVCWNITGNPNTTEYNVKSVTGGTGIFVVNIGNEITWDITYYLKAYATNNKGTGYGNEIVFMVNRPGDNFPSLTTHRVDPASIKQTTALFSGTLSPGSDVNFTERGFFYSTHPDPTSLDNKVNTGAGGIGNFTYNITGLSPDKEYYMRAYAKNSKGTLYGAEFSFKTLPMTIATVKTSNAVEIGSTTATLGGIVTEDGGDAVTERGVCWSTSQNPTILSSKTSDGKGNGSFTSSLTGLTANTTYYVRAYAINNSGTAYGEQVSFKTTASGNPTGTFTDSRDGRTYKTVKIGEQVWMAENLAYLPEVSNASGYSLTLPVYYVYGFNGVDVNLAKATDNYKKYGVLYNFPAAEASCPEGWHLPTDYEWTTLENHLILNGYNYDGTTVGNKIAKSLAANTDWYNTFIKGSAGNDLPTNNSSGFSALPGGYQLSGSFRSLTTFTAWWTSTRQISSRYNWIREMNNSYVYINRSGNARNVGYNVRCIKNDSGTPFIKTSVPLSVTVNSAIIGGEVYQGNDPEIIERGVIYNDTRTPSFVEEPDSDADKKIILGNSSGSFKTTITGLEPNKTYYYRAYIIKSNGIEYGLEVSFKTAYPEYPINAGFFTDGRDGKNYGWVKIGEQTWMSENLAYLPSVYPSSNISLTDNRYYVYDYNGTDVSTAKATAYYPIYGVLYNWQAAKTSCPAGWHLPTKEEWTVLDNYLISNYYNYDLSIAANKIAKSLSAKSNWNPSSTTGDPGNNTSGNNTSGFSAQPGGRRYGGFQDIKLSGYWWSGTTLNGQVYYYQIYYTWDDTMIKLEGNTTIGYSVRCIKD
jgi:uncharacterized protein (TIGR02145 family)